MTEETEGRLLPRGGESIAVVRAVDAFTAVLRKPSDAEGLRARPGVRAVRPLVPEVPVPQIWRVEIDADADADAADGRLEEVMGEIRAEYDLVIHHEYLDLDAPATPYHLTGKVIVEFHPDTPAEREREILDTAGVVIKKQYSEPGRAYLVVVTRRANANPIKVANRLDRYAEVEYAEPVLVNRPALAQRPQDALFAQQWHLDSSGIDASDIAPDADISAVDAWEVTLGSRSIVVAVIDDGFDLSHPDFAVRGKISDPVDFRGGDDAPLPELGDFHGTPCAGLAIGEANGEGCVGVAPGCSFMPVRFSIEAHDDRVIEYFTYVSPRAHVASCSWSEEPGNKPLNRRVGRTLEHLARFGGKDGRGLVIVFSAGNADAPLDDTVSEPIRWSRFTASGLRTFEARGRILNGWPAHPDVIAVSACTSLNRKARYSNWGPEISVAAPANNQDHVTGELLLGRGITTSYNEYRGTELEPGRRYTNSFGGTSAACPIVAGVAALVKSVHPGLTAADVRDVLRRSADRIEDHSKDPTPGHSRGTYDDSGRSEWFGFGKVNAGAAVREALRRRADRGQPVAHRRVRLSADARAAIPDASARGVTSTVNVAREGTVRDIAVEVDILHDHIGDLRVALRSPSGETAIVHGGGGGAARDLRLRYDPATTPALASMAGLGMQASGDWTLVVADLARGDLGVLNGWTLDLALE